MDIFNIQAKKALGQILNLNQLDPDDTWLQIGVYSKSNAVKGTSSNLYPTYIIKVSDFLNTGYYSIEDEGVSLPKQHIINFVGPGVSSYDDPLNNKTIVFVPAAAYGSAGLYSQTANSTPVTNTTSELSLLDGGVGTLTVPANGFQIGDSFQANLSGHINSKNNDKLHIRVKTSTGVLLADTGQVTMPSCTNQHWDLKINFTVRSLGVAGVASIASTVMFTYTKNASNAFEGENVSVINNTTFDTTINNTLEVTAEWNQADPLNSIYTELFTLFKTY